MENNEKQRPWFFNLKNDGDSAVVRLLHSSVESIEHTTTHSAQIDGKWKRVRCLGEHCPMCENDQASNRIYIHLFDYTDNREKVWDRTDKIIPQFEKLFESWNPLHSAVVKITRIGNEFPKYDVQPQNPMNYAQVDAALIDEKIANFYSTKRTADEMHIYLETGSFPERKPYIPKDEYKKLKEAEKEQTNAVEDAPQSVDTKLDVFEDPFTM